MKKYETEKHRSVRRAFVLRGENLGQRVVHGASFTLLGVLLRILITVGSVSILARLLSPADFGYLAMATVITELAALFGNFGFASVLIQKKTITRLQIDTVFWASALLGLCLTSTVFVLSFASSWLFREPLAGEIMRVMCLTFALDGIIVVHGALISRLMRFQVDFWIQIVSILFRTSVAIGFAWNGFGVWSLVAGALAGSVLKVILSSLAIPYWPRLRFNLRYLQSTWKTNTHYFAGGFLFYVNSNIDLFIIGRSLGATALGYYQNARSLTDEVRYRMAVPLQRVLFPAFSSLQGNLGWLQVSVLRSGRLLAAIVFPIGIGIAAVADELVPVLYGDKWLAMIPALKLLGISTAIRASASVATPLFNSQDRVGLALRYSIVGSVIMVIAIVAASPWGVEAVAGAVALSSLYSLVGYHAGLRLINLGWPALWSMLGPPAVASAIMWLTIEGARNVLAGHISHVSIGLAIYVALGAVVYALTVVIISRSLLDDLKSVLAKLVRPSPTQASP